LTDSRRACRSIDAEESDQWGQSHPVRRAKEFGDAGEILTPQKLFMEHGFEAQRCGRSPSRPVST
jgi:hypothetical protein